MRAQGATFLFQKSFLFPGFDVGPVGSTFDRDAATFGRLAGYETVPVGKNRECLLSYCFLLALFPEELLRGFRLGMLIGLIVPMGTCYLFSSQG
jgi:hypothetical protein